MRIATPHKTAMQFQVKYPILCIFPCVREKREMETIGFIPFILTTKLIQIENRDPANVSVRNQSTSTRLNV